MKKRKDVKMEHWIRDASGQLVEKPESEMYCEACGDLVPYDKTLFCQKCRDNASISERRKKLWKG